MQAQEQPARTTQITWRLVPTGNTQRLPNVYRAKVPGGWLVLAYEKTTKEKRSIPGNYGIGMGIGTGVTFVPDPGHTW